MNDYNEGYKIQGESWKVWNEALFDGVFKGQKWVENANQTQLKPIIW